MADERTAGAIDKIIGQRVRMIRLEIGMSQEHLADAVGVTFQQIQKYEKGVNRIAASRLLDIGRALGVDVADLLDGLNKSTKKRGGPDMFDLFDTPGAVELLRHYAGIESAPVRRRVLDLVREMSRKEKA